MFNITRVTREELKTCAPGLYQIKSHDVVNRKTGEIKKHGDDEFVIGERYGCDRVHIARVLAPESLSRDFVGYDDLNVIERPDGYVLVDGWCRADRLEHEARIS